MITMLALLIFPALMVVAALSDLFTMRIGNWLTLALAASFFAVAFYAGLPLEAIGYHALAGGIALAITFTLFSFGLIGGGDAKLVAASVLWLGWPAAAAYLLISAIGGGVLTLAILGMRRFALPGPLAGLPWLERLHNPKNGVPYGIALAIGGLLAFAKSPLFVQLAG